MRYKNSVAILVSSLLHAALLWFFSFPIFEPEVNPKPPEPVTIEIKEHSRGKGLGNFRPKMRIPSRIETADLGDSGAKGSGEWQPDDWGYKGGDFSEIKNYLAYERLFTDINGLLGYPFIFRERDIYGAVSARLAFTEKSECDWKKIKISSHQKYLRVYILTLLKKLCSLEVVKSLRAGKQNTIDLNFNFELHEKLEPRQAQQAKQQIIGNVLMFHRAHVKSSLEYKVGPFRGLWFVPAVNLDIPWIIEKWDHYVNGVDPMAAFKE